MPPPPLLRTVLRGALPWTLLLFAGANVAAGKLHAALQEKRARNLLVASKPMSPAAAAKGIRYDQSVGERLDEFWGYIPDATRTNLIIVSGMSQMYAINDATPADQTIVEWVDDALAPRGSRAFGLAAPNLDNEEALFLLLATLTDEKTKPRAFVFGVCFDKFRNIDLRPSLQRFLRGRPALQALLRAEAEAHRGKHPLAASKLEASLVGALATEKTDAVDTSLEGRLRTTTARLLPVVAARTDLNAVLQEGLYAARNRLLGIKSSTKRPQLKSRYELNQDFLSLMADVAAAHGVKLLPYIIPLNPLAENPYVPEEYAAFKRWLAVLAQEKGLPLGDFEGVVPESEWGVLEFGPDFKHFRGPGHQRTAEAIVSTFGPHLYPAKAP